MSSLKNNGVYDTLMISKLNDVITNKVEKERKYRQENPYKITRPALAYKKLTKEDVLNALGEPLQIQKDRLINSQYDNYDEVFIYKTGKTFCGIAPQIMFVPIPVIWWLEDDYLKIASHRGGTNVIVYTGAWKSKCTAFILIPKCFKGIGLGSPHGP